MANLITRRFTGGRGEVNRGDKEGKDRSSEEGRWLGGGCGTVAERAMARCGEISGSVSD